MSFGVVAGVTASYAGRTPGFNLSPQTSYLEIFRIFLRNSMKWLLC